MTDLDRIRAERDMWRGYAENLRSCVETFRMANDMWRDAYETAKAEKERDDILRNRWSQFDGTTGKGRYSDDQGQTWHDYEGAGK